MTRAIDLVGLPFTRSVRDGIYATNAELREGFERSAMWERAYEPHELIAEMDDAGVERILIAANTGGEWEVPRDALEAVERLGLPADTRRKLLYGNTKEVYGL